jgi:hypothetical protein
MNLSLQTAMKNHDHVAESGTCPIEKMSAIN